MTRLETRLSAPLAVFALATIAILLAVLFVIAARFDHDALRHDEVLVARGLVAKVRDVEHSITPQTIWDDAVRNLDNRYDAAWAHDNIGDYLIGQGGFSQVLVLDGHDRVLLAQDGRGQLSDGASSRRMRTLLPLVAQVRAAERAAPRADGPNAGGTLVSRPVQVSAMIPYGDEIYLTTASLVRPDFGKAVIRHPRAPVVVTALKIDPDFLNAFGERFLLNKVHLHIKAQNGELDAAQAPLRDASGQVRAVIDWEPPHPGLDLLRKTLAPVLLVVGGLAAVAVLLARRGRRIAEGLIASEARAKHMALHDALTGLPNRVLFEERLSRTIDGLDRKHDGLAVLAIDLDRFKSVNDTHGHAAGDELIRTVARRLTGVCRGGETVARLGGDEFGVVAGDIDARGAAALADRLVKALAEPLELSCGGVFVSGSVGVALVGPEEAFIGAVEAVRRADVALYRAKDEGRGRYCFFEAEMDAALKARRGLEADLRQAVKDDSVWLAYQPQVDAVGQLVGVEALARWTHPVKGPISPAAFVPLAEDCGLIDELGRLVMRRAFQDSARWRSVKVAVNVSALQMRQPDFADQVGKLLAETRAQARHIELEITEGALLVDDDITHQTIGRLREMGFSLALDDFGTGFSSLSYLRRYPIDKIKIDRSFITPLGDDKEAGAVVHAIVRLAKALRLSVIAEGVETNVQREQLREIGCAQAQGFLFSAPVPADAIDALIAGGGRVKLAPVEG